MKSLIILTTSIYVLLSGQSSAQRLGKFESKTGSLERNGGVIQVAYPDGANYFGYMVPDSGTLKAGPVKAYLYFQLREDVGELGIRVISPVPGYVFPDKGDLASEKYMANEQDKTTYFNPQFSLSRDNGPSGTEWQYVGKSPAKAGGKNYEALLRIYDEKNKKAKPNKAGFYRLEISAADTVNRGGSFLVQLGTTSELKSLVLTEKADGH